jgi:selenium donor protein
VDDPFDFGRIAAANSLSDIYAMGATPIFALNIVAFPEKRLPLEVLSTILKGAQQTAMEAGIPVLGGHTIEDNEPKFGWVVLGLIQPDKIVRNIGAKPGDGLLLTKPIGTGILTTALKRGLLNSDAQSELITSMTTLNAGPAQLMQHFPVSACTDVTGFGLLGHLSEMLAEGGLTARLSLAEVPVLQQTYEMLRRGNVPGGTYSNLEFLKDFIKWPKLSELDRLLLCDAQTSGGLLMAVASESIPSFLTALKSAGNITACQIGQVESYQGTKIIIEP